MHPSEIIHYGVYIKKQLDQLKHAHSCVEDRMLWLECGFKSTVEYHQTHTMTQLI